MTVAIEAIDRVGRTLDITRDALQVVAREVRRKERSGIKVSATLANTLFEESSLLEWQNEMVLCKQAADDFAILSLWAIFERRLMTRLEDECRKMQDILPSTFNQTVLNKVIDTVEFWRIDEALDLIKPLVGGDLVGQAKQIKRYRDWVAHRNPHKPIPAQIDPATAIVILKNIAAAFDIDAVEP